MSKKINRERFILPTLSKTSLSIDLPSTVKRTKYLPLVDEIFVKKSVDADKIKQKRFKEREKLLRYVESQLETKSTKQLSYKTENLAVEPLIDDVNDNVNDEIHEHVLRVVIEPPLVPPAPEYVNNYERPTESLSSDAFIGTEKKQDDQFLESHLPDPDFKQQANNSDRKVPSNHELESFKFAHIAIKEANKVSNDTLPISVKFCLRDDWKYVPDSPQSYSAYIKVIQSIIMREGLLTQIKQVAKSLDRAYWEYAVLRIKECMPHDAAKREAHQFSYKIKPISEFSTQLLSYLKKLKRIQKEFSVIIAHHRGLSINITEYINKWRKLTLGHISNDLTVSIYWKDENYLVKMMNDYQFLQNYLTVHLWLDYPLNPYFLPLPTPSNWTKYVENQENMPQMIDLDDCLAIYHENDIMHMDRYRTRRMQYKSWLNMKRQSIMKKADEEHANRIKSRRMSYSRTTDTMMHATISNITSLNQSVKDNVATLSLIKPHPAILSVIEEIPSPLQSMMNSPTKSPMKHRLSTTNNIRPLIDTEKTDNISSNDESKAISEPFQTYASSWTTPNISIDYPLNDPSTVSTLPLNNEKDKVFESTASDSMTASFQLSNIITDDSMISNVVSLTNIPTLSVNSIESSTEDIESFSINYGYIPSDISEWKRLRQYCHLSMTDPDFWNQTDHNLLVLSAIVGFRECLPEPKLISSLPDHLIASSIHAWNVSIKEIVTLNETQLIKENMKLSMDENKNEFNEELIRQNLNQLVDEYERIGDKSKYKEKIDYLRNRQLYSHDLDVHQSNGSIILEAANNPSNYNQLMQNIDTNSNSSLIQEHMGNGNPVNYQNPLILPKSMRFSTKDFFSMTSINLESKHRTSTTNPKPTISRTMTENESIVMDQRTSSIHQLSTDNSLAYSVHSLQSIAPFTDLSYNTSNESHRVQSRMSSLSVYPKDLPRLESLYPVISSSNSQQSLISSEKSIHRSSLSKYSNSHGHLSGNMSRQSFNPQFAITTAAINRVDSERSLIHKINGHIQIRRESYFKRHPNSVYRQVILATKIQSAFRGYIARNRYQRRKLFAKNQQYVTKIQRIIRGYLARKSYVRLLKRKRVETIIFRKTIAKRFQAAVTITRCIRSFVLSKQMKKLAEKHLKSSIDNPTKTKKTMNSLYMGSTTEDDLIQPIIESEKDKLHKIGLLYSINESDLCEDGIYMGRRKIKNYIAEQLGDKEKMIPIDLFHQNNGNTQPGNTSKSISNHNNRRRSSVTNMGIDISEPSTVDMFKDIDVLSIKSNTINHNDTTKLFDNINNDTTNKSITLNKSLSFNRLINYEKAKRVTQNYCRLLPKGFDENGKRLIYQPFYDQNPRTFMNDPKVSKTRLLEFHEVYQAPNTKDNDIIVKKNNKEKIHREQLPSTNVDNVRRLLENHMIRSYNSSSPTSAS